MKMYPALQQIFQVKTEVIGPDPGQQREASVLNRVIRWEDTGITWEPDPRHAEISIEQMGLKGGRSLKIPAAGFPARRRRGGYYVGVAIHTRFA